MSHSVNSPINSSSPLLLFFALCFVPSFVRSFVRSWIAPHSFIHSAKAKDPLKTLGTRRKNLRTKRTQESRTYISQRLRALRTPLVYLSTYIQHAIQYLDKPNLGSYTSYLVLYGRLIALLCRGRRILSEPFKSYLA